MLTYMSTFIIYILQREIDTDDSPAIYIYNNNYIVIYIDIYYMLYIHVSYVIHKYLCNILYQRNISGYYKAYIQRYI